MSVINFSNQATLEYPVGNRDGAYDALSSIVAFGGTCIASGVKMTIAQLSTSGTGFIVDRRGIIAFMDGRLNRIRRFC